MRPTKLTNELQEEICKILRNGNYIETACAFVGISKTSVYEWLKRGRRELDRLEKNPKARLKKEEAPFVEFLNAVKKAQAHAEIRDVTIIGKAAENDWKASAWRLERRSYNKWGRKDKLEAEVNGEVTNTQKQEVSITQQIEVDEESQELLMELWRRKVALQQTNN